MRPTFDTPLENTTEFPLRKQFIHGVCVCVPKIIQCVCSQRIQDVSAHFINIMIKPTNELCLKQKEKHFLKKIYKVF